MSNDLLLAIDNGTQSIRALLFDSSGNLLGKSKVDLQPYYSTEPGWAEQSADYYWKCLGQACQQLWQETGIDRSRVRGVALTTQRGSIIHVDKDGKPLRPAIIWLDQRRTELPKITGPWGWAIQHLREQSEVNWVAQEQPEIAQNAHQVLLLSGFLTYKMTGRFADSRSSCVAYLPFNYHTQAWAGPRHWMWKALSVRREQLPELVDPGQILGHITRAASEYTGIPEGLPMIAAGADKACEALGCGGLTKEIACLSYGTTATINTTSTGYQEITRLLPAYPAAIPSHYNHEVMIYRGFWMVNWFKQEFAELERQRAKHLGVATESLFDEHLNSVPPGSMGLMLQPYWTPGIREPGLEAKGAVIGFGDVHRRAHLYRAIIEGLAYALRQGKERIEKRTRTRITQLRVSGGGSQSDAVMQMTADIFGMPAERPHTWEASGLGAAMACAVGLGMHKDFPSAVAAMTRTGSVFIPNPDAMQLYERLYQEVYLGMYNKLRPLYQKIREITGYPP